MPQLKCVGTSVSLTSNPVFNRLEIGLFNTDCSYWVHSFKCSFQNDEISGLFVTFAYLSCHRLFVDFMSSYILIDIPVKYIHVL